MYGNAAEWARINTPPPIRPVRVESFDSNVGASPRNLRGGCYDSLAVNLCSAYRMSEAPQVGTVDEGFRVVRTLK